MSPLGFLKHRSS